MRKFFPLFFLSVSLFAFEGEQAKPMHREPWFTGPILAGSGNTVRRGHINMEPYIFATARTSFYNNDWSSSSIDTLWNIENRFPVWFGLTDWMELKVIPVWSWNYRDGQKQFTLGDGSVQLSFELHRSILHDKSWLPSIKLSFRETFPMGKYDRLNPHKLGTDGIGFGCYRTFFALSCSKVIELPNTHFFSCYLNLVYSIPTIVHVKGFNTYGGGYGTDGVVTPDQQGLATIAFEYELTQNWALACDFQGFWGSKIQFSGKHGVVPFSESDINPLGIAAANERQAAIQYSLAPAIEYSWSNNLGLIAGVWFTVAGKNSSHFTSGVIAVDYYH